MAAVAYNMLPSKIVCKKNQNYYSYIKSTLTTIFLQFLHFRLINTRHDLKHAEVINSHFGADFKSKNWQKQHNV